MLKDLFEYVVGLAKPEIVELGGCTYSDKKLHAIPRKNAVKTTLQMSTLSSLVDYIKGAEEDFTLSSYLIQVASPTEVRLLSQLDEYGDRDVLATVSAKLPDFRFDYYYDSETFLIGVRSKFQETEDRELVIKFAGSAEKNTLQSYKDDGISQKVTVSSGIASKEDALVPGIVSLKPFTTFTEIEQPEREFVFRMRESSGIECALIEADGGAWRHEAMWHIQEYLEEQLKEVSLGDKTILVIA